MEFTHNFDQAAYDKAKMKLEKMLETETGRKFFIHLVRSFVHNIPVLVTDNEAPIFRCDLTSKKLISAEKSVEFRAHFTAKYESFERTEGDTDEVFELKREAYKVALISSNPYAMNLDHAYTNIKTDKKICEEAVKAIQDVYDAIKEVDTYGEDFKKALKPYVRVQKSKSDKNSKSSKSSNSVKSDRVDKFNKRTAKRSTPVQKHVEFEVPAEEKKKVILNDFSALKDLKVNII